MHCTNGPTASEEREGGVLVQRVSGKTCFAWVVQQAFNGAYLYLLTTSQKVVSKAVELGVEKQCFCSSKALRLMVKSTAFELRLNWGLNRGSIELQSRFN